MSSGSPIKSYHTKCGHCGNDIEVTPPYYSGQAENFWAPCPRPDCRKISKYFFINGEITGTDPVIRFIHYNRLKSSGGIEAEIADLAAEACDAAYREANRGAAVILRAAAELLAIADELKRKPTKTNFPGLKRIINDVRYGRYYSTLDRNIRRTIADNLDYVRNLGDTAAHPRVNPPARGILPVASNVNLGKKRLEQAVAAAYGW